MKEQIPSNLLSGLRHNERSDANEPWLRELCGDAADEIERLQRIEAGGSRERGTSPNRSCGTAGQSGPASSLPPSAFAGAPMRVLEWPELPSMRAGHEPSLDRQRLEHYWKFCNVLTHPSYMDFQDWLKALDEDRAERCPTATKEEG